MRGIVKHRVVAVVLLVLGALFATVGLLPSAKATTLYVGGAGPGNFTTIQGAIDAANPGDKVFVYNGTYRENVEIDKALTLTGENKDMTVIDGDRGRSVILISADWVNISGFTVTELSSSEAGVRMESVRKCRLSDSNVSGNRQGVYVHNSSDITIADNTASANAFVGIRLYETHNSKVSGNRVSNAKWGIAIFHSHDNVVAANTIWNNSVEIFVHESYRNVIDGNMISAIDVPLEDSRGLFLERSEHNVLRGNTMTGGGIFIRGEHVSDWNTNTIDSANTVNGRPIHYLKDANGGEIPSDVGQVIVANCSNLSIENHYLSDTVAGIQLAHSSNVTIANNTVSNSTFGIWIENSNKNLVVNNTILSNGLYGLSLWRAFWNTIVRNVVAHNSWGMVIHSYEGWWGASTVYHNDLIGNTHQACDDGYQSAWDDGYPSGGNYWSDYAGFDNLSGPNQNEPGSDGIGDTPVTLPNCPGYCSSKFAQDRYPVMEPFSFPSPPSAPRNLEAAGGFMKVTLKWQSPLLDGGSPITNYTIYRGSAPGAETFLVEAGNVLTYVDTGLTSGKTYYYRVSARSAIGEGPKSNEASATVPFAVRPPSDDVRVPWINISLNWTGPQPPIPQRGSQTPDRSPIWDTNGMDLPPYVWTGVEYGTRGWHRCASLPFVGVVTGRLLGGENHCSRCGATVCLPASSGILVWNSPHFDIRRPPKGLC